MLIGTFSHCLEVDFQPASVTVRAIDMKGYSWNLVTHQRGTPPDELLCLCWVNGPGAYLQVRPVYCKHETGYDYKAKMMTALAIHINDHHERERDVWRMAMTTDQSFQPRSAFSKSLPGPIEVDRCTFKIDPEGKKAGGEDGEGTRRRAT